MMLTVKRFMSQAEATIKTGGGTGSGSASVIDETEMAQNIFQFSFDEKFQMVNSYDELI